MRAPLGRLVEGAAPRERRPEDACGGRGPVEIATLGRAFNEMANSLERDARERDRVEQMKDDFVLTVSHELRTPVTVVKGFAEMLTAQRKSLNSRQFEAAEVIAESAGHLQKMINDLLDLARSDAGKLRIEPEPTPVRPLAQRIGRQMRPHFEGKDQRLTVSVEKDLPGRRGRRRPDRAGARQSPDEREQVLPRGRSCDARRGPGRGRGRVRGLGYGAGTPGGAARARLRPLLARGERRDPVAGAQDSGWRSPSHWWNCTAARSPRPRSRARALPFVSCCRSPRTADRHRSKPQAGQRRGLPGDSTTCRG